MVFSARSARLVSLFAGTRLHMLLASEFSEADCMKWGIDVRESSKTHRVFKDISPILNRLEQEPEFAIQDLRWNSISFGMVTLTSGLESFLQEVVTVCLRCSSALRKKAFAQYKISALELEESRSIDEIRLFHIDIIANENTSGAMFSKKFKKALQFLNLPNSLMDKQSIEFLDSIWKVRNRLAHEHHAAIKELVIVFDSKQMELRRLSNKTEYLEFVLEFCAVFRDVIENLIAFDQIAWDEWSPKAE